MPRCLNFKIKESGFSLLEAILAIFVITVGVIGTYTLVTRTVSSLSVSSNKLIASYLAQEGVEIVRNIRDTNWLEGAPWDGGLTCSTPPCEVDYHENQNLYSYTGNYLNLETATGMYAYDAMGTPTPFVREITITPDGTDILEVSVLVEWQERGRPQSIVVKENLYNWQ